MTNGEAPKNQSAFSEITIKSERERHQVLVQVSAVPKQSFSDMAPPAHCKGTRELQAGSKFSKTSANLDPVWSMFEPVERLKSHWKGLL